MSTDAKRAGNARHAAKLDEIRIKPPKEEGTIIRDAAEKAKQPLQRYILQAIHERMQRESRDD